ncbi:hypothetical protein ES705_15967 [subsurface metagenome]
MAGKETGLGILILAILALLLWKRGAAAPPPEFECPYCGAKFTTEDELLTHIELEHPDIPPAPPPEAGFAYISEIKRHGDYFSVDVQNTGEVMGVCTIEGWEQHLRSEDSLQLYRTDWALIAEVTHILTPGEVKTFGDANEFPVWMGLGHRHKLWAIKFAGEPGEIIATGRPWD